MTMKEQEICHILCVRMCQNENFSTIFDYRNLKLNKYTHRW